MLHNFIH
jgi:hypothetical protein